MKNCLMNINSKLILGFLAKFEQRVVTEIFSSVFALKSFGKSISFDSTIPRKANENRDFCGGKCLYSSL